MKTDIHYILAAGEAVAIYKSHEDTSEETLYLHKDHLGSVVEITDESGTVVESLSYDAFGQRRDATDWDGAASIPADTARGYTGHEHLEDLNLVHMNGRVYDPGIGGMISADPTVQFPGYSQSYNRYSYVLNNPLRYTDPSGYCIAGGPACPSSGLGGFSGGGLGATSFGGTLVHNVSSSISYMIVPQIGRIFNVSAFSGIAGVSPNPWRRQASCSDAWCETYAYTGEGGGPSIDIPAWAIEVTWGIVGYAVIPMIGIQIQSNLYETAQAWFAHLAEGAPNNASTGNGPHAVYMEQMSGAGGSPVTSAPGNDNTLPSWGGRGGGPGPNASASILGGRGGGPGPNGSYTPYGPRPGAAPSPGEGGFWSGLGGAALGMTPIGDGIDVATAISNERYWTAAAVTAIGVGSYACATGRSLCKNFARRVLRLDVCCFVAGTLVATQAGAVPIEEIEEGDLVWSRDEETGETALKPVTALIRRHEREIWEVEIVHADGQVEVFETTDDHPWWIVDAGWVKTADLMSGQHVTTKVHGLSEIRRLEQTERVDATFNLTVADFETYFVGEQMVLVHNCPNPHGSRGKPDHQRRVDELFDQAQTEAGPGELVLRERRVQGYDSRRIPDVQILDDTGTTRQIYEAERFPERSRNLLREGEYDRLGIPNETSPLY